MSGRRTGLILLGITCLLPAGTARGLDPRKAITQYVHEAWGAKHGLPQNGAFSPVQSRDGYIWFGNESGLVRFDGVRFTFFDRRSSPPLAPDFVLPSPASLLSDREGSLWLANGRLTRLKDGVFSELGKADGLTSETVNVIYEDREGSLWIGTRAGVTRLKDGALTTLSAKDGLVNDLVLAIVEARDGGLWIGTEGGLSRLRDGHLTSFTRRTACRAM